MTKDPNLIRRGLVWGLRIAVPKKLRELRAQVGAPKSQKEIWRTTGKSDLSEARIEAARLKLDILTQFRDETLQLEQLLVRLNSAKVVPDFAQLERYAFRFQREMGADLAQERIRLPSQRDLDATLEQAYERLASAHARNPEVPRASLPEAWDVFLAKGDDPAAWLVEQRQILVKELREHLMRGNYHLVDWAIQEAAHQNHWDIPTDSDNYKTLGRMLSRAWIHQLDIADQNFLQGEVTLPASNVSPLFPDRHVTAAETQCARELLSSFVDRYLEEQHPGETRATKDQRRATVRTFIEVCGDRAPKLYSKQDVSRFKEVLRKLPANAARDYKGKTAVEVLAVMDPNTERQSVKTANDKLNKLAVFGTWLGANVDGVDASTFRTTTFRAMKGEKIRVRSFTDEQVAAIFGSTPFVGCESERNQLAPGSYRIRDWRFWIPMIAAFSGARLNEIAQLAIADVAIVDGVPTLKISDEGEKQSVKTRGSARLIPIHSQLLELGFLQFVEDARAAGQSDLFETITPDSDGRRSNHPSRTFRKLLVRLKMRDAGGERGGLHRFRHSVADRLRLAGYADHEFASLLGHESGVAAMTGKYGSAGQSNIQRSKTMIESIRYSGMDGNVLR